MAAQAAHWFDLPSFYSSCDSVLCDHGTVAILGYPILRLLEANPAPILFQEYYRSFDAFWEPGCNRGLLDASFQTEGVKSGCFKAAWTHSVVTVEKEAGLEAFRGYLGTWSAYRAFLRSKSSAADSHEDPADLFIDRLRPYLKTPGKVRFAWDFFLLAAKKLPK